MHPLVAILALLFFGLVGLSFYGVIRTERSIPIVLLDVAFCLLSIFISLYSWYESKLFSWAVGFGSAAAVFLLFAILTLRKPK